MKTSEFLKNQIWEIKYQMLQSFCGQSDDQLKEFKNGHWPISWHIQHSMYVIDFMINMHIYGYYLMNHSENYKHWPLHTPTPEWEYPTSIDLQKRWIKLLNKLILTIDSITEKQLNSASETGYNDEPLIECFLRIINHTNAHIRCIWSIVSIIEKGDRLPEQGMWMPKIALFSKLRKELSDGLQKAGNSQSPMVRKLAKKYYPDIEHHDTWTIIQNCEDMMSSNNGWEQMIVGDWIERIQPRFTFHYFYHFERWLFLYIKGWGPCDDFCKRIINPLLMKHNSLFNEILKWTKSKNIWVRRASAVSLIRIEKNRYVCDYE